MKMMKLLAVLALLLPLAGCLTDEKTAKRVLEDNGYQHVTITGYNWLACSEDDDYATGFKAISPAGKLVSGAVCSSWFGKGATIRFD